MFQINPNFFILLDWFTKLHQNFKGSPLVPSISSHISHLALSVTLIHHSYPSITLLARYCISEQLSSFLVTYCRKPYVLFNILKHVIMCDFRFIINTMLWLLFKKNFRICKMAPILFGQMAKCSFIVFSQWENRIWSYDIAIHAIYVIRLINRQPQTEQLIMSFCTKRISDQWILFWGYRPIKNGIARWLSCKKWKLCNGNIVLEMVTG